jgi:hypothetical protein
MAPDHRKVAKWLLVITSGGREMAADIDGTVLLVCEDDAGGEHVLHIHSRGSNVRLMELHACW